MPTTRIYPLQEFSEASSALPDIVRFLINDHPSITGPGWTIVEAQAGGNREVPGDPSDLDSLTASSGWVTGSVAADDWIVLESANANNSNHFQLYIELESATGINFMLIPFEDFETGGAVASPPLFPTSSFGNSSGSFVTLSVFDSSAQYTVIADEGMMALLADQTGSNNPNFTYIGEIDSIHPEERAYVIRTITGDVGHTDLSTAPRWRKLSPIDNVSVISATPAQLYSFGANTRLHDTVADRGNLFGLDSIFPVTLWFESPSYCAGYLRNCYSAHENLPEASGTLSGSSYLHRRDQAEANIVLPLDGISVFGRDSSGSLLLPPNHSTLLANGGYTVDVDLDNTRVWGVTGSVTRLVDGGGTAIVEVSTFVTGTIDRNRLRITYPSRRRRPRPANIIEQKS